MSSVSPLGTFMSVNIGILGKLIIEEAPEDP
jgi:hypothetical protein